MKLKPNTFRDSLRKSSYNYWWVLPWYSMKCGCPLKAIQIFLVLPSREFLVNKTIIFLIKRSNMICNALCWAQWMGRPCLTLADKGADLQVFDPLRLFCRDMPVLTMLLQRMNLVCVDRPLLKWKWWEAALLRGCNAIQRCRRWYFTTQDAAWTSWPHLRQDMAANTCRQDLGGEALGRLSWPSWWAAEMWVYKP